MFAFKTILSLIFEMGPLKKFLKWIIDCQKQDTFLTNWNRIQFLHSDGWMLYLQWQIKPIFRTRKR